MKAVRKFKKAARAYIRARDLFRQAHKIVYGEKCTAKDLAVYKRRMEAFNAAEFELGKTSQEIIWIIDSQIASWAKSWPNSGPAEVQERKIVRDLGITAYWYRYPVASNGGLTATGPAAPGKKGEKK